MQSFVIVHHEKQKREDHITTLLAKEEVSNFDITRIIGETSLGIEEIRQMQKNVFLTPVKSKKKAIILEDAHTLTIEAQNALLKLLEEPPTHALFFLSTATIDSLLPTIVSRCTIITIDAEEKKLTQDEITTLEEDYHLLSSSSIAQRMSLAERIAAQKDAVALWLRNMTIYLRTIMLEDIQSQAHLAIVLTKLQEAYKLITTTNTNPRIILEHSFLSH